MRGLRDYQDDLFIRARRALIKDHSICIQLATGGGKTPIMAAMCEAILTKNKTAWVVVPRNELLFQMSKHLLKWGVSHGLISANSNESKAYKIHVVSKDTLIRRYEKIKVWPDFIFFDEAHIALDRQIEIISHLPETSKQIGFTATPERLDGRGLSEVYQSLIEGPSIPWLTEKGYLTQLDYFAPPIEGLDELKRSGTELDAESLDDLLKRKKIYGEVVGHYETHGKGMAALIFCRNVKAAYETAENFRNRGFNFHCLEGKLSNKRRADLINALTNGEIDGLTNCEIATYGLDIPRIEYGASIRPTLSKSLYLQMIGRLLRPFTDIKTGYVKTKALFFDHVNLILEHQEEDYPGVPLHYVPQIKWNFEGLKKKKRKKLETNIKLCPYLDFFYCEKPHCSTCIHNKDQKPDARQPMVVVPTELEKAPKPVSMAKMPSLERKKYQDNINSIVMQYKTDPSNDLIVALLKIAKECGYAVTWVYHQLTSDERYTVNIPLLHEIAKIKGYKSKWVHFVIDKIKKQKEQNKLYEEVMT